MRRPEAPLISGPPAAHSQGRPGTAAAAAPGRPWPMSGGAPGPGRRPAAARIMARCRSSWRPAGCAVSRPATSIACATWTPTPRSCGTSTAGSRRRGTRSETRSSRSTWSTTSGSAASATGRRRPGPPGISWAGSSSGRCRGPAWSSATGCGGRPGTRATPPRDPEGFRRAGAGPRVRGHDGGQHRVAAGHGEVRAGARAELPDRPGAGPRRLGSGRGRVRADP
jgi:hypothetical protein